MNDLTLHLDEFAQAVASFCAKEAGTRAQRDAVAAFLRDR